MEQVVPFDWHRMLLGPGPPLFALEILFRTSVIWLWTFALLRWVGGRTISQLSIIEFLLVIALGSAVGDSMFYPEVPLFHAVLVITIVVLIDKILDSAIRRFRSIKTVVDGIPVAVLENGILICDGMQARKVGTMEVKEMLRIRGIENLGSVRAVFMEPSGQISVFPLENPQLGLPILPTLYIDVDAPSTQPLCCGNCGNGQIGDVNCENCGQKQWVKAEMAPKWSL